MNDTTTTETEPGAPTKVVLYTYASGQAEVAAEFHRAPDAGVTLTVVDPVEGILAQDYFDDGVPSRAEGRMVPASEPEAFMRALVEPSQSSYVRFVDESAEPTSAETRDEARAIVERYLDTEVRVHGGTEVTIYDEETLESDTTWLFVYNSAVFAETGDEDDLLIGNAPLLVDKATGKVTVGRTDIAPAAQL